MGMKITKSLSSHNTANLEAPGEVMGWTAINLLDARDSHQSDMKAEKLEEVKLLFRSSINAIVLNSSVGADSYKKE